ncbi:MAG: PspC domain-containing protein [Chloroflexi bacterium]|nr:PspC domain-containing protein [Chloroflexota bacterium]
MNDEPRRRLRRSHDRKVAGVAGGLAEYLDVDPTLVRLGLVVGAPLSLGAAVAAYVVLWLLMPGPEASPAPETASPSTGRALAAVLAVALVTLLAGGLAWTSLFALHALRVSVPLLIVIGLLAWLVLRSRGATTS